MWPKLRHSTASFMTRLSVSPVRLVSYVMHATGLERIYKLRYERRVVHEYLTADVVAKLPKHSLSISGARMDPVNLVFVADAAAINRAFKQAGWTKANPASPAHLLYGLGTVIFRKSYQSGPFSPHFINIGLQDFAYQMLSNEKSFKRRHHVRVWRTGQVLPDDRHVWVAAASFDVKLKVQFTWPFIHHAIDPNLDGERDFLAASLAKVGAKRLEHVQMNAPVSAGKPSANSYGAKYFTDGRAEVISL